MEKQTKHNTFWLLRTLLYLSVFAGGAVFLVMVLYFFIMLYTNAEEIEQLNDQPQAASSAQLEKDSIIITLTAEGDVFYGSQAIGLKGIGSLVEHKLHDEEIPVIIEAEAPIPDMFLFKVIDEAKMAGATKVSPATRQLGS